MNPSLFAKVIALLVLVICKQGSTEEQTDSEHNDEAASREKRGLNMLRLGRGLQMLRLGKRGGLNMLRLGRASPNSDELTDYLYNILANEDNYADEETLQGADDYLIPQGNRYRRSTERAVALPRIGKEIEGLDGEEELGDYEKKVLAMLGQSGDLEGYEPESEEEKRALGMLRLGKRPMSMLRLGKRPMSMLRLGKRPMSMLRLGKRPMSMLRLGKRPMSMLRLGKRPMSMLRLGKRPMSMLRLGKRDDGSEEKRALGMLRLGKRSEDSEVAAAKE